MDRHINILLNFLNRLFIKANEPRNFRELLMGFGLPTTIIFGMAFALNPKFSSLNFLALLVGIGLMISALCLKNFFQK